MKTYSVTIKNGRTLPTPITMLIDEDRIVRAKVHEAGVSSHILYALSYSSKDRPAELVIATQYAALGLTGLTEYAVFTSSTTKENQLFNLKFLSFGKDVKVQYNGATVDAVEFEYKEGGFLTEKIYVDGVLGTDQVEVTTTTTTQP